jgi:predicted 3-demethylubiquinone-9 3-methyltransferase (glyoxalase superfamily)
MSTSMTAMVTMSSGPPRSHAFDPEEEPTMPKITPFLWFDDQAEEAARFYTSVLPDGKMLDVGAMTVSFEIGGQRFTALNGGQQGWAFNESVSFVVDCATQEEVDRLWAALTDGGEESQCGWLKDRYGLSWQIVPKVLPRLLGDPDPERAQRAMAAMLKMRKLDIAELERAADGG